VRLSLFLRSFSAKVLFFLVLLDNLTSQCNNIIFVSGIRTTVEHVNENAKCSVREIIGPVEHDDKIDRQNRAGKLKLAHKAHLVPRMKRSVV